MTSNHRGVLGVGAVLVALSLVGLTGGHAPAHGQPPGWVVQPVPSSVSAAGPAATASPGPTLTTSLGTPPERTPEGTPDGSPEGTPSAEPGTEPGAEPGTTTSPAPGTAPAPDGAGDRSASCPPATGGAVTQAPGTGRTVALTFDDGPGDDTPALLDVLRARGVPATFFVVGAQAQAHPDLVAREAAEGHLLGDHTWHHWFPRTHGWTHPFLDQEMRRTDAVISTATGLPVCWFRPPGGFMPSGVLPAAHGVGQRVALWSVDPKDWQLQAHGATGPASARITDTIVRRVAAGLGQQHPLVLMHDGGGSRHAGVAAVGRIIDLYRAHGYRFVRLDGVDTAPAP